MISMAVQKIMIQNMIFKVVIFMFAVVAVVSVDILWVTWLISENNRVFMYKKKLKN
jgi:hypothetical protein